MRDDSVGAVIKHLKRLRRDRSDIGLARARERLIRLWPYPFEENEFWWLIARFDAVAIDRKLDGSIKRYSLGCELLSGAAEWLRTHTEQEEPCATLP